MLSDAQIRALPAPIQNHFQRLESDVITKICAHINDIGELTATDIHKLDELKRIGFNIRDIRKEIAATLQKSQDDIYDIFARASELEYNGVKNLYDLSNKNWAPFAENKRLQELVSQMASAALNDYTNLSHSQALGLINAAGQFQPLEKYYKDTIDYAILQAKTGQESIYSAMRQTVRAMADNGLVQAAWESGYVRRLDSSVRMNILGGLARLSHAQSAMIGKQIGADGYEISYHGGFRPTHDFGGQQFTEKDYYRDILPLMQEPNCYHRSFPIILGVSAPTYSKEELDELNAAQKEIKYFEGRGFNAYDAQQRQRQYETAIRREKDRITAFEAVGDKGAAQNAKIKLQQLNQNYKKFSDAMDLSIKKNRLTGTGKIGGENAFTKISKNNSVQPKVKRDIIKNDNLSKTFKNSEQNAIIKLSDTKTLDELAQFAKGKWGVSVVDLNGLDFEAIKGTFEAMDKALDDWPELRGQIGSIGQSKHGIMATFGVNKNAFNVDFNPYYYSDVNKIKQTYENMVASGYFPTGTDWKNSGVHELGHVAHGIVAKKDTPSVHAAVDDWNKHKTTKEIVSEAWKTAKKEYPKSTRMDDAARGISGYADFTNNDSSKSETVAEAFSDVFSNGSKAQPLSIEIVRVLRERLR